MKTKILIINQILKISKCFTETAYSGYFTSIFTIGLLKGLLAF